MATFITRAEYDAIVANNAAIDTITKEMQELRPSKTKAKQARFAELEQQRQALGEHRSVRTLEWLKEYVTLRTV
jgi:hypothetical protein